METEKDQNTQDIDAICRCVFKTEVDVVDFQTSPILLQVFR